MITFHVRVETLARDDFAANDLRLFHQECGGGPIRRSGEADWCLYCTRCHLDVWVVRTLEGNAALARTAIDGETRSIEALSAHV